MTETLPATADAATAYYFAATIPGPFEEALARTIEALEREGFGIISRIDVKAIFAAKLGVEFRPYTILGACNPRLAFEAIALEDKIGTMLPCNVVVQQAADMVEVAAIDPVASMQAVANPELLEKAALVGAKLRSAVRSLSA